MNDAVLPFPPRSEPRSKNRPPKTLAREVLSHVFSGLSASPAWVTRQRPGFTWWATGHTTRVWAEPPVTHDGFELTRLNAETAFIRGVKTGAETDAVLARLNRAAVFDAIVRDEADPSRLTLRSSVFVHREVAKDTGLLLRQAIGLQAIQAHFTHDLVTPRTGGEPDVTPHPKSGLRTEPEVSICSLDALSQQEGKRPSRFEGDDLPALLKIFERPPCLLASGDEASLVAEFPFLGESSLLRLSAHDVHGHFGSGLRARLTLPVGGSPAERAELACRLNRLELEQPTWAHLLGAWCDLEDGVTFTAFYPNFLYRPRLAVNIGFSFGMRARWVAEKVFHDDWNRVPARSAVERLVTREIPS
jgi:hypothetical protein